MKSIYFVAGEASADNHGAALMRALRNADVDLELIGRGGPQMKAVARPQFKNWIDRSGVLGLWEVIKRYPFFRRQFRETLFEIEQARPDAVVLIDYPGFNLRLARALRRNRAARKIIYYISPQVWAWNRGRIRKMARWLDLVLCIFPFEAELYNRSGLRAVFVGHPMMERLPEHKVDTGRDPNLIGLFPGSRSREIRKIFPTLLETSRRLRLSKSNLRFEIAAASAEISWDIQKVINWHRPPGDPSHALEADPGLEIKIGETNAIMQRAFVGIVASGSATLEAAYFRLPFVLVYKVSWLTYFVGKLLVRINFIGMPNVLANKEIVPEYIQHRATTDNLSRAVSNLIDEPSAREKMISEFDHILSELGGPGASERAAKAIIDEIR
jgi:lipid-A-disaccharide synthase